MTHRENIRGIAEKCTMTCRTDNASDLADDIEAAILAGIEAVLEAEPSEGMEKAGATQDFAAYVIGIYRAMSAELIKELKC